MTERHSIEAAGGGGLPRGSLPLVLLVIVGGAVVAIAASGAQLLRGAIDLGGGSTLAVRVLGLAMVGAGAWWLLRERERIRAAAPGGHDPTLVGVRTAATIMGAVALLALLNPPPPSPDAERRLGAFAPRSSPWGADLPGGGTAEARTRGGDPLIEGDANDLPVEMHDVIYVERRDRSLFRRAAGILAFVLLLFVLVAAKLRHGRRLWKPEPEAPPAGLPLEASDAEASLEASLDLLALAGDDPRAQITSAYHRLLSAMTAAGAPREMHEAPHEHLHRVLGPLGVRPEPLHRLTALYVLAQFGGRPVGEEHRAAAAEALEVGLADLRRSVGPTLAPRPTVRLAGATA